MYSPRRHLESFATKSKASSERNSSARFGLFGTRCSETSREDSATVRSVSRPEDDSPTLGARVSATSQAQREKAEDPFPRRRFPRVDDKPRPTEDRRLDKNDSKGAVGSWRRSLPPEFANPSIPFDHSFSTAALSPSLSSRMTSSFASLP